MDNPSPIITKSMIENWEDIEGYKCFYQISNFGRVKSLMRKVKRYDGKYNYIKERILISNIVGSGYLGVILSKNAIHKTITIHRLVASAFINKINVRSTDVNHIDGNKLNNNVKNLSWCTKSENSKHAYLNGLNTPPKSQKGKLHKRSIGVLQILDNKVIKEFDTMTIASNVTGVYQSGISRACSGILLSAGGFIWKYKQ